MMKKMMINVEQNCDKCTVDKCNDDDDDDDDDTGRARAENSQFVTLASHDKGVQEKEAVNFIREMMMRDAIKELQVEMRTRYDTSV